MIFSSARSFAVRWWKPQLFTKLRILHTDKSGLMSHLAQSWLAPIIAGRTCYVAAAGLFRRRHFIALIPRVCMREQAILLGEELR